MEKTKKKSLHNVFTIGEIYSNAIESGRKHVLDELEKRVKERLRLVATLLAEYEDSDKRKYLKTVIETGKGRIEELKKIKEEIKSMREKNGCG